MQQKQLFFYYFLGGQFAPVKGGQFAPARGGHFGVARGGQFAWIFHKLLLVSDNQYIKRFILSTYQFTIFNACIYFHTIYIRKR